MRYYIKGIEIDKRTREYIEKRLSILKKILKVPTKIEVEISLDKKGKVRLEIMANDPHNRYLSGSITESIEGSIDEAVDQLKIQIIKYKEKKSTLIKRGGRSIKKKVTLDKNARF
jgi:ribosomal subunit interface protein